MHIHVLENWVQGALSYDTEESWESPLANPAASGESEGQEAATVRHEERLRSTCWFTSKRSRTLRAVGATGHHEGYLGLYEQTA